MACINDLYEHYGLIIHTLTISNNHLKSKSINKWVNHLFHSLESHKSMITMTRANLTQWMHCVGSGYHLRLSTLSPSIKCTAYGEKLLVEGEEGKASSSSMWWCNQNGHSDKACTHAHLGLQHGPPVPSHTAAPAPGRSWPHSAPEHINSLYMHVYVCGMCSRHIHGCMSNHYDHVPRIVRQWWWHPKQ